MWQKNVVQVIKLIAQGTIEDLQTLLLYAKKIAAIQLREAALMFAS